MAVPTINLDLLGYFSPILLLILVFTLIYAMLQWAKILGDNKVLHSVIAFITAIFITIFSEGASTMVQFMIPWFTILAIFMVFAIMLYKIFGASDDDVRSVIKNRPDIQWALFIVIVVIFLGALSQAFGQSQLEISGTGSQGTQDPDSGDTGIINAGNPGTTGTSSGNFNQNLGATFYHPKVLGMLLLFIIGALSISMLSNVTTKR